MNLLEFKTLIDWVTNEVITKQLPLRYQQLSNTLNRNLQPNQQSQALKPFRDALNLVLEDMDMDSLNSLQNKKLIDLEIGKYFGREGIEFIDNEFNNNPHDMKVVADSMAKAVNEINAFITKINHMKTYADYFVTTERLTDEHKNVLRIIYKNEVTIGNLADLKTRTSDLYKIMTSFAAIDGKNPSNIELVSVENGSVIFDFVVGSGLILGFIYKAVKAVLEISVLNYERKIQIQKLEKLEIDVTSSKKDLENAENKALETIYNNILDFIKNDVSEKVSEEVQGQLQNSVKYLHAFIEGGGEIDIVNPEETDSSDDSNQELETLIQEVRRLYKEEQKLIEYKKTRKSKK